MARSRALRALFARPRRVRRWRARAAMLGEGAALLALACGGPEPSAETQRSYCKRLCQRLATCSADYRADMCLSLCGDNPTGGVTNEALYAPLSDCIEAQSCAALEADATYEECYATAVAMIVPSQTCVDFCLDDTAASFECGAGYSVETCLDAGVCAWRDDVLRAAAACNETPDCDARIICKAGVFGAS